MSMMENVPMNARDKMRVLSVVSCCSRCLLMRRVQQYPASEHPAASYHAAPQQLLGEGRVREGEGWRYCSWNITIKPLYRICQAI